MIRTFKKLLCAVAVMASHGWAADVVREGFTGNDGITYYLRHATAEDFETSIPSLDERPELKLILTEATKNRLKPRVESNHYGLLIIEDESGQYRGKMTAGRILLAVNGRSPATITDRTDRFSIVEDFYDWLLELHGITPEHENVNFGSNPGTLIHRDIHAATVYIPLTSDNPLAAQFNTTTMLDAFANLTQRNTHKITPDTSMTIDGTTITIEAAFPSLIISESRPATTKVEDRLSNVFRLPYYDASAADQGETQGMRYMTVTPVTGIAIPDFSEELSIRLAAYKANNSILN